MLDNIENIFDAIFAHVDRDIEDNIDNIFNIEFDNANFETIFAYIDRDIEDNIENIVDTIFVYVDRDIEDSRKTAFNNRDCFVEDCCESVDRDIEDIFNIIFVYIADNIKDNVEDTREAAFGDRDCFVEVVSILVITNKIREDSFVNKFNCNSCFRAVALSIQFCNFCIFFL